MKENKPEAEKRKDGIEPPKNLFDVPRFLWQLLTGFTGRMFYTFRLVYETGPWILIVMCLIAIFNGIAPVISTLISRKIINGLQDVITERETANAAGIPFDTQFWGSMVATFLIVLFVFRITRNLVSHINSAATRIAGELVVNHVKLQIMHKAKEVDLCSFDLPEFYEKLENANREAGTRPVTILESTFTLLSTVISFVSYLLILATAMPLGAVVIVAVSVPSAIVNFIYRRKNFRYVRGRTKDRREMNYFSSLSTNKNLAKEIRMLGLSDTFTERYDKTFKTYYKGLRKLILEEGIWHVVLKAVASAVNCALYLFVAMQVFAGEMRMGDYTTYTAALNAISTDISTLITRSAGIYEGTLFINNLIDFMGEKPTVVCRKNPPEKIRTGQTHEIVFRDVSFRYPGADRDVLRHINLTIRPGETMVLVGLNGAGKTTLLKLLTRLYDPTEGEILLDGVNLRDYEPEELYRLFGIIFQDFGRYSVTVRENILFGKLSRPHSDEAVKRAAERANATGYIDALPDGYDTPLTRIFEPNGTELSGGQWQKLAIARAFYGENDIVILDEPTAALDPMAEQEIFRQFEALGKDKTTIFVSHRLSSATIASKIVVLENGQIVEEGIHEELMEKRGKYYTLFSTQADRYLSKAAGRSLPPEERQHRQEMRAARRGAMNPGDLPGDTDLG